MISPQTSSVAVVGLGNLGAPVAHALVAAGWPVTVSDRNEQRAVALADQLGARAVSGSAVAADIVVVVVTDDAAARSVILEPGGLLDRDAVGRGVVLHSTVLPETAQAIATACEGRGIAVLDAPVSGGSARAREGDLTAMVGGTATALEELRPVVESVASTLVHVGPPGAGAAAKLGNQVMMFSALAGVFEAIDLASAHGVKTDALLQVAQSSTGASWVTEHWGFFPETARAYDELGTPTAQRPWFKDLDEIAAAAETQGLTLPWTLALAGTIGERIEREAGQR
ncbi:NAD(P)-dependent oxidoreductase [Ruania alba]|uniref:3-hydroxyisobutyrate dehydrogenase n=1 Tax=Ruania alba TaxID=648782 RepID=A0A1H5MG64_9MICO|nr:NAD(P)-dependent oxidoreductase [Ruania alba]SEE87681.1 3-hydroxyisobutyrate dehydrogenase [Ruania alba]